MTESLTMKMSCKILSGGTRPAQTSGMKKEQKKETVK